MRLLDDSLGLRLDDRQHTFNPRPFFLNSLVRRIGFVLDCFNSDLDILRRITERQATAAELNKKVFPGFRVLVREHVNGFTPVTSTASERAAELLVFVVISCGVHMQVLMEFQYVHSIFKGMTLDVSVTELATNFHHQSDKLVFGPLVLLAPE